MKKQYDAPKAEKLMFDYEENVVASNTNAKNGKTGNAQNSCYKHNGANVTQGCEGEPKY